MKSILNCCKLQIVFKSQRKLAKVSRFEDRLPCLEKFINIHVASAVLSITMRRKNIWKLGLEKILGYHTWHLENLSSLPICNNIPSFDVFIMLAYGQHKYILKIKESLLFKRDRLVLMGILVLLNYLYLKITRTSSLYLNIVLLCYLMLVTVNLCKLWHFSK